MTGWSISARQAVAETTTNLGIIPCGTGNDVARYLHIPRTDPQLAADVVVGSRVRTIDLARTGPTYFVTVLASGFDSLVNERANAMRWPRGQMRYNVATLAELRVLAPLPYTLDLDGETRQVEAMLVAVGNGESFGGGLRITDGASLDDGLLDVVIIKPMSKARLVRVYPMLFTGKHIGIPEYEHHRVRQVTVAAPGIVAYADGERIGAAAADDRGRPPGAPGAGALMSSPSDRYAAFRRGQKTPAFTEFASLYDFALDDFQVRACHELEAGNGVLVAAPTGSGKTIVGEFAVHLALAQGRKCFYTTPIKALSNQKFGDLVKRYGADQVGLLTGDNTINGEAPIVVMTTEVLRNMLYSGSRTLDRSRLRGDGRGALPRRPVPWRGLGGGHHPPARVGGAGVALGHRLQRRGVRRVARDGPRRDHDDRRGAAPRTALPARDGGPPDV